ncbi:MAG: protein kinase [Chthoniobacteraceae bacterium]
MPPPSNCLECNAPLTPSDAGGLCPKCLLRLGLASQLGAPSITGAGGRMLVAPPVFPFDFGGYRALRLLGRGGMGAVYEADQLATGRRVALKVLGHTIDSPEMRKRFLREGRLAASVNHPNSVYIFGTEEIEGAPVIAMELVAGGTLRDQIKRGPVAVRDAVDATLQIIAGLEAAHAGGVLHRDVKPANCFVTPDGAVKVGDFGLSVSTLARSDTQLTASGTMLGTPSFAPPEQLRGDELDVRADIYSVGATLYALLTGNAPFEGDNAVNVVAAVLDKTPRAIAEFRKDAPAGLVQIVGKCLAKKRDERFADYAALREALLPFSSEASEPAPIGLRTIAGIIDCLLGTLTGIVVLILTGASEEYRWLSERTLSATLEFLGAISFSVAYFAIPEGLWGASLGKLICGLRVVGVGRAAPGLPLAIARALIVVFMIYAGDFIQMLISSAEDVKRMMAQNEVAFYDIAGPLFLMLLFVTIRQRNGFAAIHDLLTGTRVVVRAKAGARPRLEAAPEPAPVAVESSEHLGPFRVCAPIAGPWFAAYDDSLRRCVWIRKCATDTAPLAPERRDLGRAGRLRWIAGTRGGNGGWDAFEAPSGKPLAELSTQSWAAVRCWLLDLAEELDAASKDGTLAAEIGLDQVWITAAGRALLLDEPWPCAAPAARFACDDVAGAQRFLNAVANAALDRTRLPLHARDFLKKLAAGAFDRASFIIGNLRSLLAKPAQLSPRSRFLSLVLAPGLALVFGIPMGVFFLSRSRNSISSSKLIMSLHVPLYFTNSAIRLRWLKSSSTLTIASRLVFASVKRIASRSSLSGLSIVDFMLPKVPSRGILVNRQWNPPQTGSVSSSRASVAVLNLAQKRC